MWFVVESIWDKGEYNSKTRQTIDKDVIARMSSARHTDISRSAAEQRVRQRKPWNGQIVTSADGKVLC
jgi:hypothetical protein